MRRLIASINMTLDGFFDHTAMIADDELHQNANELFKNADTVLFGRITYQLMESSWPPIVQNPTGNKSIDEFAVLINNISKIVYSKTLEDVHWKNTTLSREVNKEDILNLKKQTGKNILVGSRSLIITLMKLGLIDEFQFCVHPIILGSGNQLFKNNLNRIDLKLIKTKTLSSGAIILFYEPEKLRV